jgi:hypothetical protein
MLSKNHNSFLRPLKNKGFKEEIVTKIGLYDIVKSTTLESNKSPGRLRTAIPLSQREREQKPGGGALARRRAPRC